YSVVNRGTGSPVSVDGSVGVVSGWQGDVVPRSGVQTITVPVAKGLTGPVIARFINMASNTTTLSLTNAVSGLVYQRPESLDTKKATLSRRTSDYGKPEPISSS